MTYVRMISYVPGTWYFVAPHGDGLRSIITCSCDLCRKPRKKPRRKSEDFHGNTTKLTEVPWKHYGSVKKVPHEAPYKVPRKSQGGPVGRPQSHKSPGRPMEITRKSNGSTTEVPPNPPSWYQRTPTKVPCKSHGSTKEAPREFHESPGEFPSNQHGIAMDFTYNCHGSPMGTSSKARQSTTEFPCKYNRSRTEGPRKSRGSSQVPVNFQECSMEVPSKPHKNSTGAQRKSHVSSGVPPE